MRAIPVVNHLLRVGFREKADDLTPLKVQKLLFFLHGWYLAITGDSLVDGGFEKWTYGPVARGVYEALREHGSQPIGDYIRETDPDSGKYTAFFVNVKVKPEFPEILEQVWKQYSPLTAAQLSTLTHKANTPWSQTASRETIDDAVIREYFTARARESRQKSAH